MVSAQGAGFDDQSDFNEISEITRNQGDFNEIKWFRNLVHDFLGVGPLVNIASHGSVFSMPDSS